MRRRTLSFVVALAALGVGALLASSVLGGPVELGLALVLFLAVAVVLAGALARAESARRAADAAEQRLGLFVREAEDYALLTLDPHGRIASWSSGAERLFGWSPDEVLGREVALVHGAGTSLEEAAARGRAEAEGWRLRKDGSAFWARTVVVALQDDTAGLRGFAELTRDVTESRQAQEALHKSQALYRSVVENTRDLVSLIDFDGAVRFASPSHLETLGYEPETLVGQNFSSFVHPDDHRVLRAAFAAAVRGNSSTTAVRVRASDGGWRVIEGGGTVLRDRRGDAEMVLVTGRDVTERRPAEEALRAAEMRYRTLVEQLPLASYVLAPDSRVLYVSPQIETMLGFTPDEAVERDDFWTEQLYPADRERIPAAWRTARERNQPFESEYRMIARDGRLVWVLDGAVFARDEKGAPLYVQGYLLDITKRKRAEEELVRLHQQNALVLASVGEGIFGVDQDNRITFANPAGCLLTGHALHQLLGRDFHEVLGQTGGSTVDATLDDGETHHADDEVYRRKDGTSFQAECTATPLVEAGELTGAVVVLRDTSERRHLEQQLRQSQKLEAVGQLAGGVAHDFNNLLTVIAGHSEVALGKLDPADPVRSNFVEVKRATERATALTRQLLAFSRKEVLQPRVLNLNDVVVDMETLLRRLIGEDIELDIRLDRELAPIRANPGQLEQVLLNLAVNARDAMPNGGRLAMKTANVVLGAEAARHVGAEPGDYALLEISDTGHGMDADTKARMFEPFFTTKDPGRGTGLGLATVYGIVTQSGGTIAVESAPGEGASFQIYFPRVEGEAAVEVEEEAAPPEPRAPASARGTVLVVEDEELVRQIVREFLELDGYRVLEAEGGAEAVDLCTSHEGPIDVLLTDVIMPGMSGREVAERVRAVRPGIRVVYTSGYADDMVTTRDMMDPDVVFLPKPFTRETLLAAVWTGQAP